MTNEIRVIDKAIAYEIIMAMDEDGLNALLTADDLLAKIAVPITQFDFTYADKNKLKKIMLSIQRFIQNTHLNVNSYTKAGLQAKLEKSWIPYFNQEKKKEMIAEFGLVDSFDDDGYAIFNAKFYNTWKSIFDNGQGPTITYTAPQFGKSSSSCELIDDRPFVTYKTKKINDCYSVDLKISTDEWCKIIRGASKNIKQMLQCYLQVTEPCRRIPLLQIEKQFGIKWESLNACNTALGRRVQKMLNFAVMRYDDETKRSYWSTAMKCGRKENGFWVWEPRPELMEAAEIVLREEHFPEIKRLQ